MLNREEKLRRQREANKRYREKHRDRLEAEKKQYLLDNPQQLAAYLDQEMDEYIIRDHEDYFLFLNDVALARVIQEFYDDLP